MFRDISDLPVILAAPSPVIPLSPVFQRVAARDFLETIENFCHENPKRCHDILILDDYEHAECWVKQDGSSGFAVTEKRELSNLFSRLIGQGSEALKFAQQEYDHLNLNCFDRLEAFYSRHGFEVLKREKNWHDTPDKVLPAVLYMGWEKK